MNRSALQTYVKNVLAYTGAALIVCLALYGAFSLVTRSLTSRDGERAAEAVSPFVQGAASVAADKAKEALKKTPDAQLEKESEELARKLYPLAKGALKGQLEAILQDSNRAEVPEKMVQAGKDLSEKVVTPFARGLADGSGKALGELNKTLQGVRTFQEDNKDLLNAVVKGLEALHKAARENRGLLPPPPPIPWPGAAGPRLAPSSPQANAPDSTGPTPPHRDY